MLKTIIPSAHGRPHNRRPRSLPSLRALSDGADDCAAERAARMEALRASRMKPRVAMLTLLTLGMLGVFVWSGPATASASIVDECTREKWNVKLENKESEKDVLTTFEAN